jgi:hypothetical protein
MRCGASRRYFGAQLQNGMRRASATIFPLPEIGNFGPGASPASSPQAPRLHATTLRPGGHGRAERSIERGMSSGVSVKISAPTGGDVRALRILGLITFDG